MGDVPLWGTPISEGPAFPNVHNLQLDIDFSTMHRNLIIFSKFPAVLKLWLDDWADSEDEPTDVPLRCTLDVLPLLQEYCGIWTPLHFLLPKPTLARIALSLCTPGELLSELRGEYKHITSLNARLPELDQQTLSSICACLPGLLDLRFSIFYDLEDGDVNDGFNPKATNFFSALADTPGLLGVPPTLQRLAISWEFDFDCLTIFDYFPVASPDRIPDFLVMRDTLRERCPTLRTLWFDGQDFMFKWRQLLGREEMEQENEIEDTEIENLREKLDDFWEGR
ncbi:hypothetical protein FB45DRAFT_999644 [Roridomyces roridus]|uniref:Uncharacterized protein n=1 Tax=Roridomyces roridus TaxID=1738132 RepID=A0AAD7CCB7_9AGAR|nr:hypothetical protein FB45DRAFT_999644 [Roridomyces roridus]